MEALPDIYLPERLDDATHVFGYLERYRLAIPHSTVPRWLNPMARPDLSLQQRGGGAAAPWRPVRRRVRLLLA